MTTVIVGGLGQDLAFIRAIHGWVIDGDADADTNVVQELAGTFGGNGVEDLISPTSLGGGVVENTASPLFGQAPADNQQFDDAVPGTVDIGDSPAIFPLLRVTATVAPCIIGDYARFANGDLTISISAGSAGLTLSTYCLDTLADWFAGTALPAEDRYWALLDTTGTEVVGGSYARQISYGYGATFDNMPGVTVRYIAIFNDVAAGDEILRFQVGDTAYGAGDIATAQPTTASLDPDNFVVGTP